MRILYCVVCLSVCLYRVETCLLLMWAYSLVFSKNKLAAQTLSFGQSNVKGLLCFLCLRTKQWSNFR